MRESNPHYRTESPVSCPLNERSDDEWLRERESNARPLAYETSHLPSDVSRKKVWRKMSDSNARASYETACLANSADRPTPAIFQKRNLAEGRGFEPLRPGSQDITVFKTGAISRSANLPKKSVATFSDHEQCDDKLLKSICFLKHNAVPPLATIHRRIAAALHEIRPPHSNTIRRLRWQRHSVAHQLRINIENYEAPRRRQHESAARRRQQSKFRY